MSDRAWAERALSYWLFFSGIVCASAIVAVAMPRSWHVWTHSWLGLGTFPDEPIAEYLARGMSSLCAFYGALLIFLSRDVGKYAALISFQAALLMLFSLASTVAMWSLPMPRWWLLGDFLSVWGFGMVVFWLQVLSRREPLD